MPIIKLCVVTSFIFLLISCNDAPSKKETDYADTKMSLGEQPVFKVSKAIDSIIIDGKMDEASWSKTQSSTFKYTYRDEKPSDTQKTTFRMLWDETNLYLFYHFEDKYLTARETKKDGEPFLDDCGEIFIIPVPDSLDTHFAFEINIHQVY